MSTHRARPENSLKWLLFSWHGRIDRATWWRWSVAAALGMAVYLTVVLRVAGLDERPAEMLVNLILLWPVLALSAKRWQDCGKPGWWALIGLVPLLGWLWWLLGNGLWPSKTAPGATAAPRVN